MYCLLLCAIFFPKKKLDGGGGGGRLECSLGSPDELLLQLLVPHANQKAAFLRGYCIHKNSSTFFGERIWNVSFKKKSYTNQYTNQIDGRSRASRTNITPPGPNCFWFYTFFDRLAKYRVDVPCRKSAPHNTRSHESSTVSPCRKNTHFWLVHKEFHNCCLWEKKI